MHAGIRYTYILRVRRICGVDMPRSKVTSKFQVTIPKEVREEVGLRPGEVVMVESVSEEEILVRRFRRVEEPLRMLVGTEPFPRLVPVKELEERAEER